MAVTDEFYQSGTNVGPPAIVGFLTSFFDTRKAMNDETAAANQGEDPTKLADLELKARQELGELERSLADALRQSKNDESELARTVLQIMGADRQKGAQIAGDLALKKLDMMTEAWKLADKAQQDMDKAAAYSDDGAANITALVGGSESGSVAANRLRGVLNAERAGGPGNPRHDAIVRDTYNQMVKAGRKAAADEMAAELLPAAASEGLDPNAWFLSQHDPVSLDQMTKRTEETWRKQGAGVDTKAIYGNLRALGIDPASVGLSGGTETRDRTRTSGKPSGGGSVGVGFTDSEGGRAFAESQAAGDDPYTSIQKAIASQRAYADDLRDRAAAARTAKTSPFPHANPYLANPNRLVPDDARRAMVKTAAMDPGRAREQSDALLRGEKPGNIEAEFEPGDFRPEMFEEGGDLGTWLANAFADNPEIVDPSNPAYAYRIEPDFSVTITKSPNTKGVGTKVAKGAKEWEAIIGMVGDKHPLAILAQQPAEVLSLYGKAIEYAKAGDYAKAADAAYEVTPSDNRAAYGLALRRTAKNGGELAKVIEGVGALPDDVRGEWSASLMGLADRYADVRDRGGVHADNEFTGGVERLGEAMIASSGTREKRVGREKGERAEREHDNDYAKGRELGMQAWEKAKGSDDALAKLWDGLNAAKGEQARGARDAFEMAMAGKADVVRQQRTGRLSRRTAPSAAVTIKDPETMGGAQVEGRAGESGLALPADVRAKNAAMGAPLEMEEEFIAAPPPTSRPPATEGKKAAPVTKAPRAARALPADRTAGLPPPPRAMGPAAPTDPVFLARAKLRAAGYTNAEMDAITDPAKIVAAAAEL